MNINSNNQMTSQSILLDGFSKMGMGLCLALLSLNFTQLFPYLLLMLTSLLAGYFICKMRDEGKEKVIENEKINFFESMIHESTDGILLYESEGRKYQYINSTFENDFKMNLKQLNAAEHPKFVNITNGDLMSMISKIEKGKENKFMFEVKMLKNDETEVAFEASLQKIIIDSKNYIQMTLRELTEVNLQFAEMSQDITKYEEEIQQYKNRNKELEAYVQKIESQNLEKPIQQITISLQELESESWFKLDDGEKKIVNSIRDTAIRLAVMVQDFRTIPSVGADVVVEKGEEIEV